MASDAATATNSDLSGGFMNLDILRQLGLMLGLAASIAIGFAVVLWSREEAYSPIYPNMEVHNVGEVMSVLQSNQIPYKIETGSGVLMVADDKVHLARIKLAAEGISGSSSKGFELLDQEQGLGTSQFMETTRYRRGLEGELARTINSMQGIRGSRVHLAIPRSTVFVRAARKPRASVFLELSSGRRLSDEKVQSVVNLVASAVSELDPGAVTVVDQKGQLLSSTRSTDDMMLAAKQFDYNRKLEEVLSQRIHRVMEPMIGIGHFTAEATVDMDFSQIEKTSENFQPERQMIRSEQVSEEKRSGGLTEDDGGSLVGEPDTQIDGGKSKSHKVASTRNFEIDKSISYTKFQVGNIRKLSIAVMVDDRLDMEGENPGTTRKPWEETELTELTELIKGAVGFDAARGDTINIINNTFLVPEQLGEIEEPPIWEAPWVLSAGKQALGGLFVLILVFGVLRPILKSLSEAGAQSKLAMVSAMEALPAGGGDMGDMNESNAAMEEQFLLPGADDGYEAKLNAAKGMVAENPNQVAQVVQGWVAQDE
ncbi:MAG: flagellar basal-body MS-ring/collar protein FliF [Pseudomonadales bacterium]|nr:flagellar basal-body MS-ring/collar protein FliF [Pseudomonadales bacterium]